MLTLFALCLVLGKPAGGYEPLVTVPTHAETASPVTVVVYFNTALAGGPLDAVGWSLTCEEWGIGVAEVWVDHWGYGSDSVWLLADDFVYGECSIEYFGDDLAGVEPVEPFEMCVDCES